MDEATDLSVGDLYELSVQFVQSRGWQKFDSTYNLILAVVTEVAELQNLFLWNVHFEDTSIIPNDVKEEIGHEIADIMIYYIRLMGLESGHVESVINIVSNKVE
jgi:hypothetical protein